MKSLDPWRWDIWLSRNVGNCQYTLRNISEERRSHVNVFEVWICFLFVIIGISNCYHGLWLRLFRRQLRQFGMRGNFAESVAFCNVPAVTERLVIVTVGQALNEPASRAPLVRSTAYLTISWHGTGHWSRVWQHVAWSGHRKSAAVPVIGCGLSHVHSAVFQDALSGSFVCRLNMVWMSKVNVCNSSQTVIIFMANASPEQNS